MQLRLGKGKEDALQTDTVEILIVDDRSVDLSALTTLLAAPEYKLIGASSGNEALKHILERDFAVILLDVMMPGMDGFELASLIRQRDRSKDIPIIFLTAAGPDLDRIYRGYSLGAVDYLSKPVDADVVRAKVRIFAELFRKERRLQQQSTAIKEAERRERDLQLAELKLAAERRYFNLAEAVPHIVWTASPTGDWSYANRRWVEYTGISLEDSRGAGWLKAVHPDDAEPSAEAWRQAVATEKVHEIECRLLDVDDGSYRWHLCRAIPERSEDGAILAWLGTFTDFEDLKQAINARDEFISIASHELRTPLTALKLRLQSLQHTTTLEEGIKRKVDGAARQCLRLEGLIEALLDVSRVTTGHFQLELQQCNLSEVTRDAAERLREEAASAGSRIELDLPGELSGICDRFRVDQVITNLIANAMKYGRGKPISVSLRNDEDDIEILVRDEGVGIPEQDFERIFERFERVGERRSSDSGLGMGLFIVREIVKAHGGRIEVQSKLGQGSRFRVLLPR